MTTPSYVVPSRSTPTLENWTPVITDELEKLIGSALCKTCQLELAPTWLVKNRKTVLSPFITLLFNKSLAVSCVPSDLKKTVVRPLLKKAGSDTSQMKNYTSVLNLLFLSNLLERVVHNLHIRCEPLDGSEQTQAECRQDRTSLGRFQIRFCFSCWQRTATTTR